MQVLGPFLRPRGIVLIGAADDPAQATAARAASLRQWGYPGRIAVVDARADDYPVHGVDIEVYASADGLDIEFEVALVTAAADGVLAALVACAGAGVMNAVAIARGFEAAPGERRRAEIAAFLSSTPGFRLIGPNCAGVMSGRGGTILSTSAALLDEPATAGSAGLVMQSGGIGCGLVHAMLQRGAGFADFVSTGDEMDLGAIRIATELVEAADCAAVGMFLEGITDPDWLPRLATAIARTGKPVVAIRAGVSDSGREAAFGHTGRVIGDSEVARAALAQAGIRLVDTVEELCDAMTVLSVMRPRRRRGAARIGVVTPAGGAGVVAADEMARAGNLQLAALAPAACRAIDADVRSPWPAANPYDLPSLGDTGLFSRAIRAMGEHGDCDAVLACISSLAHDYQQLASDDYSGLPPVIFAHLSPEQRFTAEQGRRLAAAGTPNVPSVQSAVRALADWAGREPAPAMAGSPTGLRGRRLGLVRSLERLGGGMERWMAPAYVVETAQDAIAAARRLGPPVAVKPEGTAIEHRTDLGAIRTGLRSAREVAAAFRAVAAACKVHGDRVVVQAMAAPSGVEVLASVVRDPELGPVALCRPGGVLVELGGDTAFLTGPPSTWPATLARTSLGRLLAGHRGRPASDVAGLLAVMRSLLDAVRSDPGIAGVECNPVVVHPLKRPAGTPSATVVDLLTYLVPS